MRIMLKKINQYKQRLWRSFTFTDLILGFILLGIFAGLVFPWTMLHIRIRIIIFVLLIILSAFLFLKMPNTNLKVYIYFWKWLLFLMFPKRHNVKQNLLPLNLIPYQKFDEEGYLITKEIKKSVFDPKGSKSYYASCYEIRGFNIFSMPYEDQQKRFDDLKQVFWQMNTQMSIVKLIEGFSLKQHENYLKKEINDTSNKNAQQINQLKYLLDNLLKIKTKNDDLTNRFYWFIWHENKEELKSLEILFERLISRCELSYDKCDKYKISNVLVKIIFPNHPTISNIEIDEKINNLDELFPINDIKFSDSEILINQDLILNLSSIYDFNFYVPNYWCNYFLNFPNNTIINFDVIKKDYQKELLEKTINKAEVSSLTMKKNYDKTENYRNMEDLQELQNQIAINEEILIPTNILFINYGSMSNYEQKRI